MTDGAVVHLETRFEVIYCYKCQMPFAVPAATRRRWREKGTNFYCPAGHDQHYTETEVQRLEKRVKRAEADAETKRQMLMAERKAHEHTTRRLSATKAVVTRTKKRIGKGTCPCCKRHFANVERHMASKHPEYANEDAA